MNKILIATLVMSAMSVFAAEEKPAQSPAAEQKPQETVVAKPLPVFEVNGSFQLQMQKAFWDNNNESNLDDFFGRANFGGSLKGEHYQTFINIRAFPEGFGYEPLVSAFYDSSDQEVEVKKTSIAKFQIEQAWFKYVRPLISLQLGRFDRNQAKTPVFGNYVDQDYSGGFISRGYYHNAAEVTLTTGILSSSVLFGAGDNKLNTGYLRISEYLSPAKNFNIGASYRGNIFDKGYNTDAPVLNRFSFVADYQIIKDLTPYIETGILQKKTRKDFDVPVLIGCKIPTGGFFATTALEVEILGERKVGKEDKPVMMNLYLDKKVGTRTRFQACLSSDPQSEKTFDLRLGLRMTAALK